MTRFLLIVCMTVLLVASAHAADRRRDDPRPNIVFVMADDLGYGDTGYQGHPAIQTPVLDEIAATGIRLDRFYTAAPSCSPTRASTLTGRYHNRTGVYSHSKPINPDETTIADALAASGYATGHFGKWHLAGQSTERFDAAAMLAPEAPFSPAQLGFQHSFSTVNNSRKANPDGFVLNGRAVGTIQGESSHIIIQHALQWMAEQRRARTPLLAYIWFHTPHTPYGSTPEYLAMYAHAGKQQAYYAQVTAMDHAIGELRTGLRQLGIAENTVLVFCSDNGPGNGGSTRGPNGVNGQSKTDQAPHLVPGLIEWPGRINRPIALQTPISTLDLYPTFMDLAGERWYGPERAIDGISFASLFTRGTFTRSEPVRTMGTIITPTGERVKGGREMRAWNQSVRDDEAASRARIDELGGGNYRR